MQSFGYLPANPDISVNKASVCTGKLLLHQNSVSVLSYKQMNKSAKAIDNKEVIHTERGHRCYNNRGHKFCVQKWRPLRYFRVFWKFESVWSWNSETFWYCLCFHKRYVQNRPSSAEHSAMAEAISKANLDSKRFHSFDTILKHLLSDNFTISNQCLKPMRYVKKSLCQINWSIFAEWSVNLGNLTPLWVQGLRVHKC